jgi:hypothetical protein
VSEYPSTGEAGDSMVQSGLGLQAPDSFGSYLSVNDSAAILRRVARRTARTISADLARQLTKKLLETPVGVLAESGFRCATPQMSGDALLFLMACQEAGFYYNGAAVGCFEGRPAELVVSVERRELSKMARARRTFAATARALTAASAAEWDRLPTRADTAPVRIGCPVACTPAVSVCVPCTSRRALGLAMRLPELVASSRTTTIELILTVADPHTMSGQARRALCHAARSAGCAVTILSNPGPNRIGINRDLALREAKGAYCVLLDDDVQPVGPAIGRLVQVLVQWPDVGLVSLPSYDELYTTNPRWSKPRWHNLKWRPAWRPSLMIVNAVPGMVMAMRRSLAQVAAFPTFWPNTGEDYFLSEVVNRLGFFNAYLMAEDCWAEHLDADGHTAAASATALADTLCSACINYYLLPETFTELRESITLHWLRGHGLKHLSIDRATDWWRDFRSRAVRLIDGRSDAFADWKPSVGTDAAQSQLEQKLMAAALTYLEGERCAIRAFRQTEFAMKNLAFLENSQLGPLRYSPVAPSRRQST